MRSQLKFAYLGIPLAGGTHTVYTSLRAALGTHRITVKWVAVGPRAAAAYDDPSWSHEREHGVVVARDSIDEREQARYLVDCLSSQFDGVFINVLGGRVETNVARYLGPATKRVMIVHSITPGTYAAARAVRDHVHATVGVSPRIRSDLVRSYGFPEATTYAIPTGVQLAAFDNPRLNRAEGAPLRVLFIGRVSDSDKGVFWLPKIMSRLHPGVASLTVAGDGPDLAALRQACVGLATPVQFLGRVAPVAIPALLSQHDVLLAPSRYEGLCLVLIEAMAAGCVPLATRLKGVTDFVVTHGVDGLLFEMGAIDEAAGLIRELHSDPDSLTRLSAEGPRSAQRRFSVAEMAVRYCGVLDTLHAASVARPLPLDKWKYPRGLRRGLRSYTPLVVKNELRRLLERFASHR